MEKEKILELEKRLKRLEGLDLVRALLSLHNKSMYSYIEKMSNAITKHYYGKVLDLYNGFYAIKSHYKKNIGLKIIDGFTYQGISRELFTDELYSLYIYLLCLYNLGDFNIINVSSSNELLERFIEDDFQGEELLDCISGIDPVLLSEMLDNLYEDIKSDSPNSQYYLYYKNYCETIATDEIDGEDLLKTFFELDRISMGDDQYSSCIISVMPYIIDILRQTGHTDLIPVLENPFIASMQYNNDYLYEDCIIHSKVDAKNYLYTCDYNQEHVEISEVLNPFFIPVIDAVYSIITDKYERIEF